MHVRIVQFGLKKQIEMFEYYNYGVDLLYTTL